MIQGFKCEFCNAFFDTEDKASRHEQSCDYNPKNKITDVTLFRLGMIYEELNDIISCALYEVEKERLDFLANEVNRASDSNCCYVIKRHQGRILSAINNAQTVNKKIEMRNSSKYKDVIKENPEIFKAMVDTLNRKAWNER